MYFVSLDEVLDEGFFLEVFLDIGCPYYSLLKRDFVSGVGHHDEPLEVP